MNKLNICRSKEDEKTILPLGPPVIIFHGSGGDRTGHRLHVGTELTTVPPVRAHPVPSTCARPSCGAQEARLHPQEEHEGGLNVPGDTGGGKHEPDGAGEQRGHGADRDGAAMALARGRGEARTGDERP